MSPTPDADANSQKGPASGHDADGTTSPDPASINRSESQSSASSRPANSSPAETPSARQTGRRRRNRRDQPEHSRHDRPRANELTTGDGPTKADAAQPVERPVNRDRPATTPRRTEPVPTPPGESSPDPRRRRTEGTRPPSQGNGRGLSGSPRNPNHFGEIPIRPDNSTFDATHDRLVCIARSGVIPEDFPVQYRRMTASSRLEIVATSGSDLLLCDHSHSGPHIWPDQTEVAAGPGGPHGDQERDVPERI